MNCEEFQKSGEVRLEKDLEPSEEAEWQSHLRSCQSCRKEMEEWELLEQELKKMPLPSFPEAFWSRQREAIRSAIHPSVPGFWEMVRQTLFQPRGVLVGALAVLILFLGFPYVSHRFFKDETSPSKIVAEQERSPNRLNVQGENSLDRYDIFLAQRDFAGMDDSAEEEDPTDDLTGEELDRVLQHFEQDALRRTL